MNEELYGLASFIRRESNESQTILADFGYIPECKSKYPRGLNEISLPLARMRHVIKKSYDHACNNTLVRTRNVNDNILNAIKTDFKWSYDKQNLTRVVVLYEIYEIRQRLVS